MLSAYLDKWTNVPVAVKRFLFRAVAILIVWKVVYLVFLLPTRVLDKPLSISVASNSAGILNLFSHSTAYSSRVEVGRASTDNAVITMPMANIYFHKTDVVTIEDGCNALELFVLYAGFIICMPALLSRKIFFIIGGIILIHLVNILRCSWITYIILFHPRFADFAHHYVFTFVVYGLIIGLWLLFSKKVILVNAETEQ